MIAIPVNSGHHNMTAIPANSGQHNIIIIPACPDEGGDCR